MDHHKPAKRHRYTSTKHEVCEQVKHKDVLRILGEWYVHNARALPWRDPTTSAWGVLVSEVMSQQTPMNRVEPIWRNWMASWPTAHSLAAASPSKIIVAWANLGYPRRALRLHECAKVVSDEYLGNVPQTFEELIGLPGIGEYTANAVLCFAWGKRVCVLDTNIRRVLLRVFDGIDQPPRSMNSAEKHRHISRLPIDLVDSIVWNKAMMEFGALVCTAQKPACSICPLARHCVFQQSGAHVHGRHVKKQTWVGTDRQARGRIMRLLRELHEQQRYCLSVERALCEARLTKPPAASGGQARSNAGSGEHKHAKAASDATGTCAHHTDANFDNTRAKRVLKSLIDDGLIVYCDSEQTSVRLPE